MLALLALLLTDTLLYERDFEPVYYERVELVEVEGENSVYCYCGRYIKYKYGVPINKDASEYEPNIQFINVKRGDLVLLKYGEVAHLAYLLEITNSGLFVDESNYEPCKSGTRLIEWNDEALIGFHRINP